MPKKHINTAFLIPHSEPECTFHKYTYIYVQLLSDWFHWAQMMSTDGSVFIKKTYFHKHFIIINVTLLKGYHSL